MLYNGSVDCEGVSTSNPLTGETCNIISQPPNNEVAEAIDKYPDRFYGWIFINPIGPNDPVDEVKKYISISQMVGVKAHPWLHQYSVKKLDNVAKWCEKNGYPIQVHLGAGSLFSYLPEKFPSGSITQYFIDKIDGINRGRSQQEPDIGIELEYCVHPLIAASLIMVSQKEELAEDGQSQSDQCQDQDEMLPALERREEEDNSQEEEEDEEQKIGLIED